MATVVSETHIDLIGAEGHRFRRIEKKHKPVEGGAGIVTLERQTVGPLWSRLDARVHPSYTKLSPREQKEWGARMEAELMEHWFSLEIAKACE